MTAGTLLVIGLFVVLSCCTLVAPTRAEWLALALMIGAGIPHGSYDLRVARTKWRSAQLSQVSIVVCYLACVFSMSALCILTPLLGLSLFLVLSALHFAEGESQTLRISDRFGGVLFGLGAILLPIGLHLDQTEPYVEYFVPLQLFDSLRPLVSQSALFFTASIGLFLAFNLLKRCDVVATFERSVCLSAWILLPPLAGFAVWFIGRHSRQHIEVCQQLFKARYQELPLDFIVISLLAIMGLAPLTLLFDLSDINQLFAASICLIAGLTLPHMLVSHGIRSLANGEGKG